MPIWSEILAELNVGKSPDFDGVRRNYLAALHQHTGRDAILYASGVVAEGIATRAGVDR